MRINKGAAIERIKNAFPLIDKMLGDIKFRDIEIQYIYYRFWSQVNIKENEDECWEWAGSLLNGSGGYGQFRIGFDTWSSHRTAYFLKNGMINGVLQVQHLCNNVKCCNPRHLEQGDQSKNMKYVFKCGRRNERGENNCAAKLTEEQVREIHRIYKDTKLTQKEIADIFKVSPGTVWAILKGMNWNHIYDEFHS